MTWPGSSDSPCVLAFDTSGGYCAAVLLRGDDVLAHQHDEMAKGQAEYLMGLLADVLKNAGMKYRDLDALGVAVGPGNFTGIRIAVSAARGLAYGLKIPAVGVSNLEAMREGTEGPCAASIDARRNQYYFQSVDAGGTENSPKLITQDSVPDHEGPMIGALGLPAKLPVAEAVARIAARRFRHNPDRPAPLYLRPADAAPARDTPPNILP